ATAGSFFSVTRTAHELSIVCDDALVPEGVKAERGYTALRVTMQLDLSMTGILTSIASPLAIARIPIFAVSTHDTDWLLIRSGQYAVAVDALRSAGFTVVEES
ncbi:MAG: ACT domain-containing protein, partial [Gemmatimonadetes bacterium]|nr:ACT domain-containing protein [Gemmatimonadota bacterium]